MGIRTVVGALIDALKTIDGTGSYNLDLNNRVYNGYVERDRINTFPSVCVASYSEGDSIQYDQVTHEVPITIEIIGYVQKEDNTLDEAGKLVEDIERAIYNYTTLTNLIFDINLRHEAGSMNEKGGSLTILSCRTTFSID